jgi:hypothetical protein
MHPLLTKGQTGQHSRITWQFDPFNGPRERGRKNATGPVQTVKVRAVCGSCNSGWMNTLETSARPYMTPLITGEPVALDWEQTTTIARWIAMKSIVAEHSTPETAVTPRADREALRARGVIPDYFRIYIASHNAEFDTSFIRHTSCIAFRSTIPSPPLGGVANNIQSITFYLGRVVAHVTAARVDNLDLEQSILMPILYQNRVWPPLHHEMVWPTNRPLSVSNVGQISGSLDKFLNAQNGVWLNGGPN